MFADDTMLCHLQTRSSPIVKIEINARLKAVQVTITIAYNVNYNKFCYWKEPNMYQSFNLNTILTFF